MYSLGPTIGDETIVTPSNAVKFEFEDDSKLIQTQYCCGPRVLEFNYQVRQDTFITNNNITEQYFKIEELTTDRFTIRGFKLVNIDPTKTSFQLDPRTYKFRKAAN
jgi:hypothetical protein